MLNPFHKRNVDEIEGQKEEDECSGNTEADNEATVKNESTDSESGSHREGFVLIKDGTGTNTKHTPRNQTKVSFGHLHVREFPIVMGDNPSVQFGGPPLRLEYNERQTEYMMISIDEYEMGRGDRRTVAELRVPATLRRKWVGRNPKLEREVFRTQCQRRRSTAHIQRDKWHFQLERLKRGMRKKLWPNMKPQSLADHWCREYKKCQCATRISEINKESAEPRRWHMNRGKQGGPARKKKVQDISTFFV